MRSGNGNEWLRYMAKLKEEINNYSNPNQREVLLGLLKNDIIKNHFFLTGGTALSVFYLHHRTSLDFDFFSTKKTSLEDIYLWISRTWPGECTLINQGDYIIQVLIKDIKVDIVFDPLSFDEPRETYYFDDEKYLKIDSIKSIVANKFTTIVTRKEIKDFLDFYFLNRKFQDLDFKTIYEDACKKEAMFDDPPTVAFQLETNLTFIKENEDIIPETVVDFDLKDFYSFYEEMVQEIYHLKF